VSNSDAVMSAHDWVEAVRNALVPVADPSRVRQMTSYMKDIAPFLGIGAPQRRAAVKSLGQPPAELLEDIARLLWAQREREYAYVAVDWLDRATNRSPATLLVFLRELITTKSWWDTVDGLAHVTGNLLLTHPELVPEMDSWIVDENMWITRVAILHQLVSGDATDEERLFRLCLQQASNREFFIRKAIGWALRQHAWRKPHEVAAFIDQHTRDFSALTIREATKNVDKAAARLSDSEDSGVY
jgi:3-methyladenine DNA glycosylase AlkD